MNDNNAADLRRAGISPTEATFYRHSVSVVARHPAVPLTASLTRVTTRVIMAPPEQDAAPVSGQDGFARRMAARAGARGSHPLHAGKQAPMQRPPVHYVEAVAELDDVREPQPSDLTEPLSQQLEHLLAGSHRHRRLAAGAHSRLEEAVVASPEAVAALRTGAMDHDSLQAIREAARDHLRVSSTVPHDVGASDMPRRLLTRVHEGQPPLVLFDVSPSVHTLASGSHDVPPGVDTSEPRSASGTAGHTSTVEQFDQERDDHSEGDNDPTARFDSFLQCAERVGQGGPGRSAASRCLMSYTQFIRSDPATRASPLVDSLEPETLEMLQESHARATPAMLAVASAVGDAACQRAMCRLLLSIDYETPEVKSYDDAHDFFYVTSALGGWLWRGWCGVSC